MIGRQAYRGDVILCGLVAAISPKLLSPSEVKAWKDLLVIDQLRGKDSTGVYAVGSKGEVGLYKSLAHPMEFINLSQVSKVITGAHVLVGHNRHATLGAVNSTNAHPFMHHNITLVHNGTLHGKMPEEHEFDTDSECVAWNLSQCKDDAETVQFLETLEGAYAFIWYDDVEQCMYICRNDERTLFYTTVGDTMFFASERGMLLTALERNNVNFTSLDQLHSVPVGVLHKIGVKKGKLDIQTTKFKPKVKAYSSPNWGKGTYYNSGYSSSYTSQRDDLKLELGIAAGTVLTGQLVEINPYSNVANSAGSVKVRLQDNGHDFSVMVYGVPSISTYDKGDWVQVQVDSIDMNLHENWRANHTSQMVARGSRLTLVDPDKEGEILALPDMTGSTDFVQCENCLEITHKSKCTYLAVPDVYICDQCTATDDHIAEYVLSHIC